MIVMEFFDGAVEIGEAEIDDGVIDRDCDWSARCGTRASRTATSSRRTSWCATAS